MTNTDPVQGANSRPDISVVVSVFNEEDGLRAFWEELQAHLRELDRSFEVIFVDDGSLDGSRRIIEQLAEAHSEVRGCILSRNFGHEAAMLAGIDHSRGDAVVCMDADLQHPPDALAEVMAKRDEGYDIVHMVRTAREDAGLFHRLRNRLFYGLINRLVTFRLEPDASDFFMVSGRVAALLRREYRERTRFLRGFVQMVGFRSTRLGYVARGRQHGHSKYSLWKLLRLSLEAIITLSSLPLRLGLVAGLLSGLFALALGGYTVYQFVASDTVPAGYTTIVLALCVLFTFQFVLIGILGVYIEHLFTEVKRRPIYVVEELVSE